MATAVTIKAVCPVCGKEGTQSIFAPKKTRPDLKYMRYIHPHGEYHFVGRVRSAAEFEGEMNKPETQEEYEKAMATMTREIRELVNHYSGSDIGSVKRMSRILNDILTKYGF